MMFFILLALNAPISNCFSALTLATYLLKTFTLTWNEGISDMFHSWRTQGRSHCYTMGLNLVLDYLHNNMCRQFLLRVGKVVFHFCIITAFSTLHVVEQPPLDF